MRIHLTLLNADGLTVAEGTFESPALVVGPHEGAADLYHPALRGTLEILSDARNAVLRMGGEDLPLARKNAFDLGGMTLRVDLYPRVDAVRAERGACPSCGGVLRREQVGGAYRSIARREERCGECETVVIDLIDAESVLGAFTDHAEADWVHVSVPHACPRCLQPMIRARFRSARGEAEVERCHACALVAIQPDDEARLRGG